MGLQVWLPLNGNLNNNGLSDVTATNNGATIDNNGKIGKCYSFDGNDDFISISCSDLYNTFSGGSQPFSIAFWVYHADTTRAIIFGDYGLSGTIGFNIELTTGHQVRFYWNGTPDKVFNANSSVGINTWTHIIITYDGDEICIYKNGVQQSDKYSGTLVAKSKTSGVFYLGRDDRTGSTAFNGKLNDFRIYDHCLSPIECKQVSAALVLHYPLAMPGGENIIANTSHEIACTYPASGVKDYYSVNTKSVPNETQYTLSFEAKSTVDGDHLRTHFYSPNTTTTCESSQGIIKTASDGNMDFTLTTEWRRYWVVYTQTETTARKSVICPRLCSPASYPSSQSGTGTVYVRNQKLERGSTPTSWLPNPADTEYSALGFDDGIEYDVSGYQHNGTKVGNITYDADTPRYNTSAYFNGSSDIRSAKSSFGWFDFKEGTVAAWYKPANTTQNWASVGVQNDEYKGFRSFSICNYSGKAATVVGYDSSWGNQSSDYSMSENVWYHLCATITNGDTVKLYVNGELVQTRTVTNSTGTIAPTTQFAVGVDLPGSDERFTGNLSDVRFYSTALSAEDVLELYHAPITLANNGTLLTQGEFVES